MSDFVPAPPNIAPQDDGSGVVPQPVQDPPSPAPITEQEVGEYREQDRFLPVCLYLERARVPPSPPRVVC